MASAIRPISVDNDSVIYEHIIPRSVRQKWMRRASIDHLDLIPTSPREHLGPKKRDSSVGSSLGSDESVKGVEYGDSIVSHDVQSIKNNSNGVIDSRSESLITPEEEKAVFNAFGVKLRHRGIHAITKSSPPVTRDNIENHPQPATEVKNKPLGKHGYSQRDLSGAERKENTAIANIQARDAAKRQRPLSMPITTDKIEMDFETQGDGFNVSKAKPKAYISPHAKVPWKRKMVAKVLETKGTNISNTQSASGEKNEQEKHRKILHNIPKSDVLAHSKKHGNTRQNRYDLCDNQSSKSNKVSLDFHKSETRDLFSRESPHNGEVMGSNEDSDLLHSVTERRKTFEKYGGRVHTEVFGSQDKEVVALTNEKNTTEKRKIFHYDGNEVKDKSNIDFKNTHEVDRKSSRGNKFAAAVKTQASNKIGSESTDQKILKHQKKSKEKLFITENSQENSSNVFQSVPSQKQDDRFDKVTKLVSEKTSKQPEVQSNAKSTIGNTDDAFILRRKFEKKINKMVILTGEQRDRELKSKQSKIVKKEASKGSEGKVSQKLAIAREIPKEASNQADIPVTNLDDTMQNVAQNPDHDIPITNLDEISPPGLPIRKTENDIGKSIPFASNLVIFPPKKPGKYDADRRELVAPKVVFESPVIGLVSALSPKGKSNGKKKFRVSFVSEELETVHTYPSESVAMELYDEAYGQNDIEIPAGNSEKSIDDVIEKESNLADLHCYLPSSFSDLSSTLERERHTLARQNEIAAQKEVETESSLLNSLGSDNSLFTETSIGETNAILF